MARERNLDGLPCHEWYGEMRAYLRRTAGYEWVDQLFECIRIPKEDRYVCDRWVEFPAMVAGQVIPALLKEDEGMPVRRFLMAHLGLNGVSTGDPDRTQIGLARSDIPPMVFCRTEGCEEQFDSLVGGIILYLAKHPGANHHFVGVGGRVETRTKRFLVQPKKSPRGMKRIEFSVIPGMWGEKDLTFGGAKIRLV